MIRIKLGAACYLVLEFFEAHLCDPCFFGGGGLFFGSALETLRV